MVMEAQDNTLSPEYTEEQEDKKEHHTASRSVVALAFAYIGHNLWPIGLLIDGASIVKGEKNKLRTIFDGTLRRNLKEQIKNQTPDNPTSFQKLKARTNVFKYTFIATGIGVAAGGILGWMRGSRIESPKFIIKHPIKATKLVLGIKDNSDDTDKQDDKDKNAGKGQEENNASTPGKVAFRTTRGALIGAAVTAAGAFGFSAVLAEDNKKPSINTVLAQNWRNITIGAGIGGVIGYIRGVRRNKNEENFTDRAVTGHARLNGSDPQSEQPKQAMAAGR